MLFAMEVNDTNMLFLVTFAFMSILVLLMFYTYIAKKPRDFTSQPTPKPVVHSHNCPPETIQRNNRGNSVNLTACTHNQRRPEENDERFCQTVGTLKNKKFDPFIKT